VVSEQTEQIAGVFLLVSSMSHLTYSLSGNIMLIIRTHGKGPTGVFNTIWKWSKWPAFTHLFVNPVADVICGNLRWWCPFIYAINVAVWWVLRNAGDDDWSKKVRKKLTETVKQLGTRLVVVPTR
jgi:hypothetical protein